MRHLFVLAALLFALPAEAVTIDWVTVGDPGNACDLQWQSCFGAVAYPYLIGKYEVTNAEYAEFLDAKAASDPLGLYNTSMGSGFGGITRSGSAGSYSYSAIAGREQMPVNFVSFYDSLRFANWLHNGQGSGDTETGAYTLLGGTAWPSNGRTVTRNADATIFLTSEDEWYKAAYYDASSLAYNLFPFADGFNGAACETPPGTTSHSANCGGSGHLTDVGSYTGSASPNATFDQGGNVREWHEAIMPGSLRGLRGGYFGSEDQYDLAKGYRPSTAPSTEFSGIGFRVAMIPEPSTALLLATGLAGLAAARRRRD